MVFTDLRYASPEPPIGGAGMPIQIPGIHVDELVLHELSRQSRPQRGTEGPTLSEAPSPLDEELREFLSARISSMAGSRDCFPAKFDATADRTVYDAVSRWREEQMALVAMSQQLAVRLSGVQSQAMSPGILAVASCAVAQERTIAILKLEKESGVRLERGTTKEGGTLLGLRTVRELILSERTRFFKQAYIRHTGREFEIHVTDTQRAGSTPAANFFLGAFLGGRLAVDARVATRDFLDASVRFLNEEVSQPEERQELALDLISYLRANRPEINVERFAEEHLPAALRDPFRDFIVEAGVPLGNIVRDVSLVASRLQRVRLVGDSGIVVVGSAEAFEERVEQGVDGGRDTLTIRDTFRIAG